MNWTGEYPKTHEAVDAWRERLQNEMCLNDAARAAVAEAARVLDSLIDVLDGLSEAQVAMQKLADDLEGDDHNVKAYERTLNKLKAIPRERASEIRHASKLVKEHIDAVKGANGGEADRRELELDKELEAERVEQDDWESTEEPAKD